MKLIEKESVERDYGFDGIIAIVESDKHGRLLIVDGFGGMDSMEGGAVRFKHGVAIQLKKDDTLEALQKSSWNEGTSHMSAVLQGYDNERAIFNWDGFIVEKIARSSGLIG